MAKCRTCGTDIPEGAEYCAECLSKLNTAKDSESYLDSLLNAVMTEEPERREIVFPKKEASSLVSVPEEPEIVPEPAIEDEGTEMDPGAEDAVWDDFMQDFFEASEEVVPEETTGFSELAEESDDSVTFPEEETAEEVPEEGTVRHFSFEKPEKLYYQPRHLPPSLLELEENPGWEIPTLIAIGIAMLLVVLFPTKKLRRKLYRRGRFMVK